MTSPMWALLLAVGVSITGGHSTVLHRDGHRQGREVEGVGVLFERESHSAIQCVAWCMATARCTAVTLTSSPSPQCRGHAAVTTSTLASTSVWLLPHQEWLEKNCSSNAQCGDSSNRECVGGLCLCSPGYYFSHTLNSCVIGCAKEKLQPQFLAYPGHMIFSNNMICLRNLTRDACLAAFRQNADARTCDQGRTRTSLSCCLQAVTKHDVPASEWLTTENLTHFQKICA